MKKLSILCYILLFFVPAAFAQDSVKAISIEEVQKEMSKGNVTGYKVVIPKAIKADIEKSWSKTIRHDTKNKVENIGNESIIRQTNIKTISSKPQNVFAIINPHAEHVEMFVFFEIDSNRFLAKESHETEALAAEMFLRNFATDAYRDALKNELNAEKDRLKTMEKELSKATAGSEKLHDKINSEERKIRNIEKKIETSRLDQKRVRDQVHAIKDELLRMRNANISEDSIKEIEKKQRTYEKQLSKLEKAENNLHKDIDKCESKIREYEREISDDKPLIEQKRDEIARQREVVSQKENEIKSLD